MSDSEFNEFKIVPNRMCRHDLKAPLESLTLYDVSTAIYFAECACMQLLPSHTAPLSRVQVLKIVTRINTAGPPGYIAGHSKDLLQREDLLLRTQETLIHADIVRNI